MKLKWFMTLSEAFARGQRESAKSTIYVIFILVGFFFFTTSFAQRQRDFAQSIKGTRWRDSPPHPCLPWGPSECSQTDKPSHLAWEFELLSTSEAQRRQAGMSPLARGRRHPPQPSVSRSSDTCAVAFVTGPVFLCCPPSVQSVSQG